LTSTGASVTTGTTVGNPSLPRPTRWHPDQVNGPEIALEVAPELRLFVAHDRRGGRTPVTTDGSSTLGHVVESLGIPLT
ncbi:hypothetical protein NL530_28725, partial [Klebsiella pneumoniae]|nr:hypothetical protein [Klebsiella pneumoniae]